VVYDACSEEVRNAWVAAEGFEDGEDAADFVGLEEGREVGEGGYKDDAGEGFEGGGLARRGDEVRGKVSGGWVGKVEGAGGCYGCAETLAEEDGAGCGVVERGLNVGEEGDGVGDYTGLCGDVGWVGQAGQTETSVVAGEKMDMGNTGDRTVS
jgi:hypothetical protein